MAGQRRFIAVHQSQAPFFVGIDLGGTNIKVGVVDDLGRPLSWLSIPTEVERGPEDAARRMGEAVPQAVREAGLEPEGIARVGLGSPGSMDIPRGVLTNAVNLTGWDDFPIRNRVGHYCGLPVTFENDANAPPTASIGSARAATTTAWSCSPSARASAAALSSAIGWSKARTATGARPDT